MKFQNDRPLQSCFLKNEFAESIIGSSINYKLKYELNLSYRNNKVNLSIEIQKIEQFLLLLASKSTIKLSVFSLAHFGQFLRGLDSTRP